MQRVTGGVGCPTSFLPCTNNEAVSQVNFFPSFLDPNPLFLKSYLHSFPFLVSFAFLFPGHFTYNHTKIINFKYTLYLVNFTASICWAIKTFLLYHCFCTLLSGGVSAFCCLWTRGGIGQRKGSSHFSRLSNSYRAGQHQLYVLPGAINAHQSLLLPLLSTICHQPRS